MAIAGQKGGEEDGTEMVNGCSEECLKDRRVIWKEVGVPPDNLTRQSAA